MRLIVNQNPLAGLFKRSFEARRCERHRPHERRLPAGNRAVSEVAWSPSSFKETGLLWYCHRSCNSALAMNTGLFYNANHSIIATGKSNKIHEFGFSLGATARPERCSRCFRPNNKHFPEKRCCGIFLAGAEFVPRLFGCAAL